MRAISAVLFTLLGIAAGQVASTPAQADPYRWCATYAGGDMGGGQNCYFMTIEQCRAALSGNGGFCDHNPFYDGRPVVTPGSEELVRRKKHASH